MPVDEDRAAAALQARVRGQRARRERQQQQHAALALQARSRGARARKDARERQAAARTVQSRVRLRRGRSASAPEQARVLSARGAGVDGWGDGSTDLRADAAAEVEKIRTLLQSAADGPQVRRSSSSPLRRPPSA